jgi:hypothetical protein
VTIPPPPRPGLTGEQITINPGEVTLPPAPLPPRRGTGEQSAVPPMRHGSGEHPLREAPPPGRHTGDIPVVVDGPPPRGGTNARRVAELRRQAGRTPVVVLAVAAFVLLVALPAIFLLRDSSTDPVYAGLDGLNLPGWAAQAHQDTSTGSRWCVDTCRLRERVWRSSKPAQNTDPVYRQALTDAGWHQVHGSDVHGGACPAPPTGVYTCWQRDEFVLDLWTRDAACDLGNVAPAPGKGPSTDPSAGIPSPGASEPPKICDGSLVTVKATERANRDWHAT